MKAVRFTGKGGPEVVELAEVEAPRPSRGEVLVRVRAAAMNRADLLQRRGLYPPPPGFREAIPGLELAGEIAALGEGVTGWKVGDAVMAIAAGEAQAELAVVHERMLLRIPAGLSLTDAGALTVGTSRTADKLERARALGLDHAILVGGPEPKFADEVKRLTGRRGAAVILD